MFTVCHYCNTHVQMNSIKLKSGNMENVWIWNLPITIKRWTMNSFIFVSVHLHDPSHRIRQQWNLNISYSYLVIKSSGTIIAVSGSVENKFLYVVPKLPQKHLLLLPLALVYKLCINHRCQEIWKWFFTGENVVLGLRWTSPTLFEIQNWRCKTSSDANC